MKSKFDEMVRAAALRKQAEPPGPSWKGEWGEFTNAYEDSGTPGRCGCSCGCENPVGHNEPICSRCSLECGEQPEGPPKCRECRDTGFVMGPDGQYNEPCPDCMTRKGFWQIAMEKAAGSAQAAQLLHDAAMILSSVHQVLTTLEGPECEKVVKDTDDLVQALLQISTRLSGDAAAETASCQMCGSGNCPVHESAPRHASAWATNSNLDRTLWSIAMAISNRVHGGIFSIPRSAISARQSLELMDQAERAGKLVTQAEKMIKVEVKENKATCLMCEQDDRNCPIHELSWPV